MALSCMGSLDLCIYFFLFLGILTFLVKSSPIDKWYMGVSLFYSLLMWKLGWVNWFYPLVKSLEMIFPRNFKIIVSLSLGIPCYPREFCCHSSPCPWFRPFFLFSFLERWRIISLSSLFSNFLRIHLNMHKFFIYFAEHSTDHFNLEFMSFGLENLPWIILL